MFQENVVRGTRVAVISANEPTGPFSTRLYVNAQIDPLSQKPVLVFATATLICKKAKTITGARKQATEMLSGQ